MTTTAMLRGVIVALCENDEHGMPCGRVSAAHFSNAANWDTPPVLELESPWLVLDDEEDDVNPTCERIDCAILIGGQPYAVRQVRYHVGNILWNGYLVSLHDARTIAAQLSAVGFTVDAETQGQPFLDTGTVWS